MALLRKGSSRISEENFNCRLRREKAKTGAVTASLAWNDPSDLDLHGTVFFKKGDSYTSEEICYRNKIAAGGQLDVDMHARDGEEVPEPVENIFWKKPPAGLYSIKVNLYRKRGTRDSAIPFRVLLKRDDEEDLSREGAVEEKPGKREVECFRFTVDDDGEVTMERLGTPLPVVSGSARKAVRVPMRTAMRSAMKKKRPMKKAMKVMKVMKVMKKKAMKVSAKKAKVQVYEGRRSKTKSGLKKEDLVKSKKGRIVSANRSKHGRESKWAKATAKARAIKGYTGFKVIKKGNSFYAKAKEVMAEM